MVDKSKALDIDGSMASHEWSTEEFNHVLPTFTEMVGDIWLSKYPPIEIYLIKYERNV